MNRNVKILSKTAVMSVFLFSSIIDIHAEAIDSIIKIGSLETPGSIASGVFVQGDFAYVANQSFVNVIDISVPTSPLLRDSVNPTNNSATGIFIMDTLAFLNNGPVDRFTVLNVANPDSPYVLGWTNMLRGDSKGIFAIDTLVYLASGMNGFHIINVSDPQNPTAIGSFNSPGSAIDLFVKDTLVYLADGDSLQIVNVSDPFSPFRVGAVVMPTSCLDVSVDSNYAFVVCEGSNGFNDGSLQIVDVSNPASPIIVDSIVGRDGDPYAIYIQGNYAYIVSRDSPPFSFGGLWVVNISDPLNPVLAWEGNTPGDAFDVFTAFPYIYVADSDSLQIYQHTVVGIEEEEDKYKDIKSKLLQNQPNPFNQRTVIRYQIKESVSVILNVYDIIGRVVRTLVNDSKDPGSYSVYWDRKDDLGNLVGSGVYFYNLIAGQEQSSTKKMVIIR